MIDVLVLELVEKHMVTKKELSDSEAERLSFKLNQLQKGQMISVTYYNKDAYEIVEGLISNFDDTFRALTIVKTVISFDDIT